MQALRWLIPALVLPLAVLLCAQWPLREFLGAYARLANDIAQVIFAVYVAVAMDAASRAHAHIALHRHQAFAPDLEGRESDVDAPATVAQGARAGGWRTVALAVCVMPWAGFTLWFGVVPALSAAAGLERFPESLSPGYFAIKLAVVLMVLLAGRRAIATLRHKGKAA